MSRGGQGHRDLDRLREATRTGQPFGGKDFVAELEARMERNLEPQKRGRKPKPAALAASASAPPMDRLPDGAEKGYLIPNSKPVSLPYSPNRSRH